MSTVVLHQQTKNAKKKKNVSWAEGMEWKKGEEEKTRTRKAAFKHRRVGVKRERMVTRTKEAQAEWNVDKAELMYYYLIDDNPTVYEKIAEICVRKDDAMNNLIISFMVLEMGRPDTADIKSIKSALSKFGVLGKTNNDAHEQEEKKTGNDDGRWDAWKKNVADPYKADKKVTPLAATALGILLTSLSKYDRVFDLTSFCDLTTLASSEKSRARKMCDAGDMVKDLPNSMQQACMHYARYKNPDNPESAIQHLLDNWNLDKKEEAPPIEHVNKRAPGGSAASSLSGSHGNTPSPSRKKMKLSVPVETANDTPASPAESRGKSSMTKNDEH